MGYASLNVVSKYSALQSLIDFNKLAKSAPGLGIESIALTDIGNMYGVVDFYSVCKKEGIVPIVGCEFMVVSGSRFEKKKSSKSYPLILLSKNRQGYHNLCKLTSYAYMEGFYYFPRIDLDLLEKYREGLICLSGPYTGKIGVLINNNEEEELQKELKIMKDFFGDDFYLQISRHGMSKEQMISDGVTNEAWLEHHFDEATKAEENIVQKVLSLRKTHGLQYVGVNRACYIDRKDWYIHEVLMNLGIGDIYRDKGCMPMESPKRKTLHSHEMYLKSFGEMQELFKDCPEAISNGLEIAKKVKFEFDFSKRFYPSFVTPEGYRDNMSYLSCLCKQKIPERYTKQKLDAVEKIHKQDPVALVEKRLSYELSIIKEKNMCDYLLIVHDFVSWAKSQNIPVGPGRGSGAGAIISYLIGITEIEPLSFNLLFERFINPQRPSYPDIDIDICMENRHKVIEYTIGKYGEDNVAQITTFGTMKARMVIKDVGRILNVPLKKLNLLVKLVTDDLSINNILESNKDLLDLYQSDQEVKKILDLGKKIEGSIRSVGTHAAGIIISDKSLLDQVPVCLRKDSSIMVTQYSMQCLSKVGLLKIDFLGLKTLSCIKKSVDFVRNNRNVEIDWLNLPLDNKKTFDLISSGNTSGMFQLESSGMKDLVRSLKIDKFEEIIAVGALYRPGPMKMISSYIRRKHNLEEILYDHPSVQDILKETYGIMVYQEQVMQIAGKFSNYSLAEGDVLRRAIGKKDHKVMEDQRLKFTQGAISKGIEKSVAISVFNKIEQFASYGFNKSHATCYGYITYATAFLKANYPKEWMAALMTCDLSDISKIAKHIRDCIGLGVNVCVPDINESSNTFVPVKSGVRFALTAIKGIGESVVKSIVMERGNSKFLSLQDFLSRVNLVLIGSSVVEALIWAGVFDFTGMSRISLVKFVQKHFNFFYKKSKDIESGVMDLFFEESLEVESEEEDIMDKLYREKKLLGCFLTGNPMEFFRKTIESTNTTQLDQISNCVDGSFVKVAFVIEEIDFKLTKSKTKVCILRICDISGYSVEILLWSSLYKEKESILKENSILMGIFKVEKTEMSIRLHIKWVESMETLDCKILDSVYEKISSVKNYVKKEKAVESRVEIYLFVDRITLKGLLRIKNICLGFRGKYLVVLHFMLGDKILHSVKSANIGVNFGEDFKNLVKSVKGVQSVSTFLH